jgi:hypothetical protein
MHQYAEIKDLRIRNLNLCPKLSDTKFCIKHELDILKILFTMTVKVKSTDKATIVFIIRMKHQNGN